MTKDNDLLVMVFIYKESRICISKSDHDEFMKIIEDILPAIKKSMKLTLQQICGNHYWLFKTRGERRTLGKYFAYLVDEGLLPFEFAYSRCGAPKCYRLK